MPFTLRNLALEEAFSDLSLYCRLVNVREARVGQSPILIDYGQPLFVWLSRD